MDKQKRCIDIYGEPLKIGDEVIPVLEEGYPHHLPEGCHLQSPQAHGGEDPDDHYQYEGDIPDAVVDELYHFHEVQLITARPTHCAYMLLCASTVST